ncbi:sigma 54-interacting transcriptional regulator [Parahaliea aestuarii]|uniref:Sigma-54-dependent Fis family transcriptional regulator n=1 Tax=Parahaliea aestuarii TaxID=1852021 RepID=A0A5C9A6Z0_9GAMM|nr:sigma 54-interacting transcriptional regulator [Parahaliea aestuarii]TXS94971.1 sigma-54-dependent Fis family transcriptional regulator [Parahaliea aestuarii]
MTEPPRTEATLPSLIASLAADYGDSVLSLTVLFHPDPRRIGAWYETPLGQHGGTLELGRLQPVFCSRSGEEAALGEGHVSRQALQLHYNRNGLRLQRRAGACACRLDGLALGDEVFSLDRDALNSGCVLQLGHALVLWLHCGPARGAQRAEVAPDLLGSGAAMCALRQQIARVGPTDLDVLILGETGTGKEEVATALHRVSDRAREPLVPINMAAIPAGLAPSLLFGSVRGAYTGAAASRGYFRQAEGGTLFMDEIGATAAEIQPQLLRALQQRQVQVVGGALEAVNVRVIAATDSDLDAADSNFSSALRYRLGSIEVLLPPLRERREDLGELLLAFLRREAAVLDAHSLLPGSGADPMLAAGWAEVIQRLARYDWPGNVRELANTARQLLLGGDGGLVMPAALEARLQGGAEKAPQENSVNAPAAVAVSVDDFRAAHTAAEFEVAATARRLGVSRQAVYRRLQESGFRLASEVSEDELAAALAEANGDVRRAALALRVSAQGLRARLRQRGR